MVSKIIAFSLEHRAVVLAAVLLIAAAGVFNMQRLPVDAVPDITDVQVQILTNATGLGPVEVEKFITFPVESAMSGVPGVEKIRSISKFGLSAVTVIFREGTNIYLARQLVGERLAEAKENIPPGYGTPKMAPITTGLGEIFQFEVKGEGYSLMELRAILDWQIAYQLRTVPGVVEVNSHGGQTLQYQVQLDPNRLFAYRFSVGEVFEALQSSNRNVGSGYIEHNQEQYVIRGEGLLQSIDDIRKIVVKVGERGAPVYLEALGKVEIGPAVRRGAASRDGKGEVVQGIVLMLKGENSRAVIERVKAKIQEIGKALPPDVTIEPFYDRASLIDRTIHTVAWNLTEGGLLVILVLFLTLGNLRAGLLVSAAIPLSMLMAFTAMYYARVSGNLMSLGAIDFGLIVDSSVIMVENIMRHLSRTKGQVRDLKLLIYEASAEVLKPATFGVFIILMVYFPILTLQGIEGKMFLPMAMAVIFAIAASFILSLTFMPATASFVFCPEKIAHQETWLIRMARKVYEPTLDHAIRRPRLTVSLAVGLFLASLVLLPFMGAEFIPQLDEGDITVQATLLPSVSLEHSVEVVQKVEKTVLENFPDEVRTVVSRTGSPEIGLDPMGVELSDIFVMLHPKKQWKKVRTKDELVAGVSELLNAEIPGAAFSYTQPIEMRFNELISGVRSDIGVMIFGENFDVLKTKGEEVARVLSRIDGAKDVKVEQVGGLPVLRVALDYQALARHGIHAEDALTVVEAAVAGKTAGAIVVGQRRHDLTVKFLPEAVRTPEDMANLPVGDVHGHLVPLGQLAKIVVEEGPAQVSREDVHRRIVVECNIRGRDVTSFVAEAKKAIEKNVVIPSGYYITWGGTFQHLQSAQARLFVVVPIVFFLIFIVLFMSCNSGRLASLIFLNVPMAATGGILALWLRGLPLSISAGIGFIALFGVAVLNGLVLVSRLRQESESSPEEAARSAALARLRPVLMTALVASLGFVPMALATSAGAEVQRPLATVVIGGLITSTALTLLVLPAIYKWFAPKHASS